MRTTTDSKYTVATGRQVLHIQLAFHPPINSCSVSFFFFWSFRIFSYIFKSYKYSECSLQSFAVSMRDSQARLHVLINHIADADSWNDFHEVWQDAPVESKETIFGYNLLQQATHGNLLWWTQRGWKERQNLNSSLWLLIVFSHLEQDI